MIDLKSKAQATRILRALELCTNKDAYRKPLDCISVKLYPEFIELVSTDSHILLKVSIINNISNRELLEVAIQDRYEQDGTLNINSEHLVLNPHSKELESEYVKYEHILQIKNKDAKVDNFNLTCCNIHYLATISTIYTLLKVVGQSFKPSYQNGKYTPIVAEPYEGLYIILMPLRP